MSASATQGGHNNFTGMQTEQEVCSRAQSLNALLHYLVTFVTKSHPAEEVLSETTRKLGRSEWLLKNIHSLVLVSFRS